MLGAMNDKIRPLYLGVLAALGTLASCASLDTQTTSRPNILIIMIDDLGWMDLACQGNPRVHTPHIDRLATQGVRFTDAYAAAPVCSPTRASILTGKAPARLRITTHIPDSKRHTPKDAVLASAQTLEHLPLEEVTLAERLQGAGYRTGFIGKWHLCGDWTRQDGGMGDPRFLPEAQGFELNIGGCARGGPTTFWDPYNIHALPDRKPGEYLPDRLADEAISFLSEERADPFFLCLWPYTVHWPMEAPEDLVAKYTAMEAGPGLKDPRYNAMIEAMDRSIGRVLEALDQLDLAQDTLLVFTSDNGAYMGVSDIDPLREGKGYLYEGGLRVPLIVRWPGEAVAGEVNGTPVISTDLFYTALDAAGLASEGPQDGQSLKPLVRGSGDWDRQSLYFHYPNYAFHRDNRLGSAIRSGDYKLIERFDDQSFELYNLAADIGETTDLAASMPQRVQELSEELAQWRTRVDASIPERISAVESGAPGSERP